MNDQFDRCTVGGFHSDFSPISPRAFYERVMPTWARVYIEVSHRASNSDLEWESEAVMREFIALAGFDPRRAQFFPAEGQFAALDASRELRVALFHADEHAQLDGAAALAYAAGWMSARDLVFVGGFSVGTDDVDALRPLMERGRLSSGVADVEAFERGFLERIKRVTKPPEK